MAIRTTQWLSHIAAEPSDSEATVPILEKEL